MIPIIRLPRSLQQSLDATSSALLQPAEGRRIDFSRPTGEAALVPPDSVSWRIFKNPIALYVGGIAAVIMELAEPAVRTGVWKHSTFRQDPLGRLQRTGLAAMVTVYGARSIAERMIQGVVRMHAGVTGKTPAGEPFCANDARLLTWVHATASFGFGEAYHRYVAPLSALEFDALYREGTRASRLYGAVEAPRSAAELRALFEAMRGRLERSDIIFDFLSIMRSTPAFPTALRWLQPLLVRAAIDMVPPWILDCLGLDASQALRGPEKWMVKMAGGVADRIVLPDSPSAQACRRLGLPRSYLYA